MCGCCSPAVSSISLRNRSGPRCGGQIGVQNFDRHPPPVFEVLGKVHGGHRPLAERPLNPVAPRQGAREIAGHVPEPSVNAAIITPKIRNSQSLGDARRS